MIDQTGAVPRSPALVGRSDELRRLHDLTATEGPGAGSLAVVVGEAGIGKTRLLDELVSATSDATVVRGRADELEPTAFGLWLAPLRQLGLAGVAADPSIPAAEQRWELVDLLCSALAQAAPALVALDDLHWADDGALWVLEQLLDRNANHAVAFVATTRPGSQARSDRWHALYRRAEVLALDGLDVGEVERLAQLLGVDLADARSLWERTGGNPLFVREQLLAGAEALPATIEGLLTSVVDSTGTDVADTVALLALAGTGTPTEVLASAVGSTPAEVDELLATALRADLLRQGPSGLGFRHDLLGEAALLRLPAARRTELHLAIAGAWTARAAASPSPDPEAAARRARHLVLALPTGDTGEAVAATLTATAALHAANRQTDAVTLLRAANAALAGLVDAAAVDRARLALAEAEACWAIDDHARALAAAEAACQHARSAEDPVLSAECELSAVRHHHPFIPDPVRAARLAEVDGALPDAHDDVDPALRARLRGRRSVLATAFPDRTAEALVLGDDAVRRARATGDPSVLVDALRDRLFLLGTPEDFALRATAAEEILELAHTTGRPELALLGHEWRHSSELALGTMASALRSLEDLEVLASIMPSPYWRYSAAVRRANDVSLLGDFDGAIRLAEPTRRLGLGVVDDNEVYGLECSLRMGSALLYGREDHGGTEIHELMAAATEDIPVLFLQTIIGAGDVVLGRAEAARRRITPWLDRFDDALRGPEGVPIVALAATIADAAGWIEAATRLRPLLAPFAGMIPAGNGTVLDVSVDHHLAELALLVGDVAGAVLHARDAVDVARRLGSSVVEARALGVLAEAAARSGDPTSATAARDAAEALAEPLGVQLEPAWRREPRRTTTAVREPSRSAAPTSEPTADRAARLAVLRLEQGRWTITSPHGDGTVADSTGMGQLVQLLAAPGVELAAVALAAGDGRGEVVLSSDLGPALDGRAKREYRRRIGELQADIDEAEDANDLERASRHRLELEAILDELRAAVGLGGRDRPQGSGHERARINTARTLRRAIAAVAAAVPDLGAHLQVSVRTGHHCAYAPEPAAALTWEIVR